MNIKWSRFGVKLSGSGWLLKFPPRPPDLIVSADL